MLTKKRKRRRQSLRRGQAMLEYSLISHVLIGAGIGMIWPFLTTFINSLNIYYEGLFKLLTSALP